MSDSVRPHRQQPTRLPRPWDSPGKNTGVGCHFLLQCMKLKSEVKSLCCVRLLATPWTAATRLLHPWDFPGKSTGVGCHCLLHYMYYWPLIWLKAQSACNVGDLGLVPGSGRSPGGRHGNPLQYSFLENSMDRGAWWATVHGIAELDMTQSN